MTATTTRSFPVSGLVAGFVAVLVGVTSSVVIVFQAADGFGASADQTASWIWAVLFGSGLTSLGLSLWYRKPVLTAWSTPGAVLLATASSGVSLAEGIGAFVVCALLMTMAGATGLFARAMNRVPLALASALLAGVLAHFAFVAFAAAGHDVTLVGSMFVAYLLGRRWWPRWAVPGVLLCGVVVAGARGQLDFSGVDWGLVHPVVTRPVFRLTAIAGISLPLFVVTMAGQNLPGVAAQRAAGYDTPVSPVITTTGLATLVLTPFGAHALNLAAITAAICMGSEADEDPDRRWMASAAAGCLYLLVSLLGGAAVGLIAAFPEALVLAVAGLALLATIGATLTSALTDPSASEAALITFVVSASGLTLWGIGAAFWAVVAGALALAIQRWRAGPRPR